MPDNETPNLQLTPGELRGIMAAKANVMQAQAAMLQAQRDLETAQHRLNGAIVQMGFARGLTEGNLRLSDDGLRLVVE